MKRHILPNRVFWQLNLAIGLSREFKLRANDNKRNQPQTIIPNILGKLMFEHIISKNTVVSHKSRK